MHLVKGVSAFLRRGSPGQSRGEGSDGRGESLVAPSWPEIYFSNEGDEAFLGTLWQDYQEALGLEETQKTLESFLVAFVQTFKDWSPTEDLQAVDVLPQAAETEGSLDEDGCKPVVGCTQGHPTKIIVGLIREVKAVIQSFTALNTNPEGSLDVWLSPPDMDASLHLTRALSIVTRASHNRKIFSYFGGLQSLMGVMKAAVVQLKLVASVVVSNGITPASATSQLSFLQSLLTYIVTIVANYIDSEEQLSSRSGTSSTAVEARIHEQPDTSKSRRTLHRRSTTDIGTEASGSQHISRGSETTGNRSGRGATGDPSSSVPLLETGGLNWFVELLRILRKLRLKGANMDASLEQLVLHSLKLTIMGSTRSQNFFRVIGGLEVLLDGIGNPLTPREGSSSELETISGKAYIDKMLDGFQMQVLSLQVLREAIFRNAISLQSMRDHGGVQKFAQLISWAAFTFPNLTPKITTSTQSAGSTSVRTSTLVHDTILEQSHLSEQTSPTPNIPSSVSPSNQQDIHGIFEKHERSSGGVQSSGGIHEFVYEGINLRGWNWRVADLCQILCSVLVPVGDAMSVAGGMQGGQEGLSTSSLYWEHATHLIIDVLLSVFQAHDGRSNPTRDTGVFSDHKLQSSTLQHYVLHVFKKMLEVTQTVLNLFRKDGVWDVMFSESFFYYGLGELNLPAYKETKRLPKKGNAVKPKWAVSKTKGSDVNMDADHLSTMDFPYSVLVSKDIEPLRLEVISFVELAATAAGNSENLSECGALMEALQQCSFLPRVATMLAKSLQRILQLVPEPTIKSFKTLNAISVLTLVMEQQQQASTKTLKEGLGEVKDSPILDFWHQAMEAVFTVFAQYLTASEEAVIEASRNSRAIDSLFNLLWDTTTRTFALSHILLLMKLAPTCEQDQDAKLDLCLKYLQSLPRAQVECRSTDISILFDLLRGMREVLETDLTYYQALFRDAECFVHIVTLLNEDRSREVGSRLSLDVLLTLTRLLQGNEASKASFRSFVGAGYKTLEILLIELHHGRPSRDLLISLLDMLVDGSFRPSNMAIQNEDVVLLFFNILRCCSEQDQFNGLDTFQLLLEESTANCAACVRAGLLSMLLDWFAQEPKEALIVKLGRVLEMVGGHSISGKDMRTIFALLRSSKDGLRPRHGTLLLQIFQGMLKEQGPAVFFDLNGRDSGIAVTSPLRWPSHHGFSFCAWARLESFPTSSSQRAEEGMMGLFSFLSESGKGCTALLCHDQLVIESISNKRQTVSLRIELQLKRWYFICITHNTQRALSGGNSIKVYLDGELAASEKLRYPKVHEMLTRCTMGGSAPLSSGDGNDGHKSSGRYAAPFCGQLGPVYLFDDAMSAEQVMGVFSLGPGYMYSFLPSEVGYVPDNISTDSIINDKDGLAFKMVFGYNAQASSGRSLFDISPVLEYSPDPVLYDATIMTGTLLCYRHLVQDSVQCVGGIGVFFPLLTQLDQPISNTSSVLGDARDQKLVEGYPVDSHVAVEVIDLLTAVLAGNFANQQYMRNISGMSVLGFLLQSVSPQHLTVNVVSALERLVTTVAKGSGASLSSALVKEALVKLYLNPHIWIFTPLVVHRELYLSLIHYFKNDGSLLPTVCGLPRVLDMLRQFYWDKPKSRRALGTKPLLHPVTKAVIGERPTRSEVRELRQLVLVLAAGVLSDRVTLTDTKVLVAFLETSEDDVCLKDVLYTILGLLSKKSLVTSFVEHINSLGGCQILLNLIRRQQEDIRLLGLRLIGVILVATVEKKGAGSSFLGTSRVTAELQRVEKLKLNYIFSAMIESVGMFPFTDAVRATLFDVLLGEACPKQEGSSGGQTESTAPKHTNRGSFSSHIHRFFRGSDKPGERVGAFVLPQVLRIIFNLMASSEDSMLRLEILKDTLGLLEANPLNSEALTLEPAWQGWLLAALAAAVNRSKKTLGDGAEEAVWMMGPEEALIRKLFRTFHVYCVCTSRGGWLHVERTCNFVHMLAKEGQLSEFHTLHVLLGDLIEAMVQGLPLQASLFTQPCRDNAIYLLSLVDELVMEEAFRLLPSPSPGDVITEESSLLSGDNVDLGLSAPFKMTSGKSSSSEECDPTRTEKARKGPPGEMGWQIRTSSGQVVDVVNKDQCWRLYNMVWNLLIAMNGRGTGSGNQTGAMGPTLGQRARGLVESLNIPAAEMAAAVVSSGLGAVGMNSPNKLVDKVFRLRGDRCPRVVFRLVMLYLYDADLQSASRCVQQFLALLPAFVSTENEQNRNRLQLFLWTLLDARAQIGSMDEGARFHVVSQLIRETVEIGKAMLATSMAENEKPHSEAAFSDSSVHSLLQRDRVVAAVMEEAKYLKTTTSQRAQEVEGLRIELDEATNLESQQKIALDDQSHVALTTICTADRTRQSAAQLAYDEEEQAISEHWCHMFRYLTDERGPWSTVPFPNDLTLRWKLDKTEDPLRRRLKLRRNYHFDNNLLHPVSSTLKAPLVDLVNEGGSVELLMGGVRHFLLKGMRGVTEESSSDDEDDQNKSKELEVGAAEVDGDVAHYSEETSSGADVTEEGATPQEQAQLTLPEEAGEEEVLLSVSCVLVSPKRKVAGRLEVMQSSLHFYGEFVVEGTGGRSVFNSTGGLNYPDAVTMEKGFNKPKTSSRKESSMEGIEAERGNAMERLDPLQGGPSKGIKRHSRWDLSQVKTVHSTRYLLQYTALEIFFTNCVPPVFFNFPTQSLSKDIGVMIVDLHNGPSTGKSSSKDKENLIDYIDRRKATDLAEEAKQQWRRREMTTFDYLMILNTLAGRSYNDMTQYPVFPWILSDYSSEKLDLGDWSSFRDLSKPVGALDKKRFEVFEERYNNFSDPDIPSFYYGSHYSSMGIVLFYLLRLEPFTLLHRHLQGGKFDHADRVFHSIESAYKNCLTNSSDVKELIPEFFYLPEFLVNSNDYFLGVKQDGEQLGNVVLPQWAKGSPELFVQKNREALESEYVSDHIHEWIDLIFGCKQRGRPAVEAANVFYHLTYEGAVDLEAMDESLERAAVEDQIANFGQTPIQLFKKKHPKRGPAQPVARPLYYAPASITMTSFIPAQSSLPGQKASKVIFVGLIDGLVVTINKSLNVVVRSWITPALQNFTFSSSQDSYFGIGQDIVLNRKLCGPIVDDESLNSCCFGNLLVRSSSFLLTCGHWDNSFKVISLDGGDIVQSNSQHKDVVTCLSVAVDGSVVVTGSQDTTVMVWDIQHTRSGGTRRLGSIKDSLSEKYRKPDTVVISDKPRHVLCGHDDAITSVAVRVELDIVVSGSKDATCIFHTLRSGRYVRSVRHPNGCPITNLKVSQHGLTIVYSHDDLSLHVCSINGKWLATADVKWRLNCMDISHCGEFLVWGGDQGQVLVYRIQNLEVVRRYDGAGVAITSLTVTPEDCFLVGTQDGGLIVFSLEFQYPKKGGFFSSIHRHVR